MSRPRDRDGRPRLPGKAASRRVVPLEADHLSALDPHLAGCLLWQLDPVRRATAGDEIARQRAKREWMHEVASSWGSCGRTVLVDGEPAGAVVYAPAAWLPGTAAWPTAPVSPDAVVVAGLFVAEEHRGGGLARMLLQGAARDLVERSGRDDGAPVALETFADTRGGRECLLGVEVWERLGFVTHRPHPTTPRMRMDLRRAVSWRGEVSRAFGRLAGVVRTRPQVQPGRLRGARRHGGRPTPAARPHSPVARGARGAEPVLRPAGRTAR